MSEISIPDDRSKELDQASEQILSLFLKEYNVSLSTYEIYTRLKSTNFSMAYVNVHKRVKNLLLLDLIREVKVTEGIQKTSLHAAKFYTLTSAGLFYLLYRRRIEVFQEGGLKRIFETYGDHAIFKMFVYPYIEKKTLLDMKGIDPIIIEIAYYLSECCQITNDYKQRLQLQQNIETFRRLHDDLSLKARILAFNIISKINGNIDLDNYKILSRDEKFMDLLKRTILSFVHDYCTFVELGKDVDVERLYVDEERLSDDLLRVFSSHDDDERAGILKKLQNKLGS
jgi:hypothetical protein